MKKSSGCVSKTFAIMGALVSILWLLNLSFGIVEIPDNVPIIGNLDEAFASWALITFLGYLGIDVIPGIKSKGNKS